MTIPALGTFGVFGHYAQWQQLAPDQLREIEALGYGAIWAGGSPPAELDWIDPILGATNTIQLATGIVNIWTAAAATVAESYHRIDAAYPGRFLLGIGVGHPEAQTEYKKPYDALNEYLDALDEHGVPKDRRVVAALGPQVLKLSARRSAGAHPYLTTPEHTAQARELIGPDAFLAPEHKVVLTTDERLREDPDTDERLREDPDTDERLREDPDTDERLREDPDTDERLREDPDSAAEQARATGRKALRPYLSLVNYVSNWKRSGFTDDDVAKPGSDALLDAVVAHGTTEQIVARLRAHLDAGANHVPVQVLTGTDTLVPALAELAGPLGLR